jgi:hypothetical protein
VQTGSQSAHRLVRYAAESLIVELHQLSIATSALTGQQWHNINYQVKDELNRGDLKEPLSDAMWKEK